MSQLDPEASGSTFSTGRNVGRVHHTHEQAKPEDNQIYSVFSAGQSSFDENSEL